MSISNAPSGTALETLKKHWPSFRWAYVFMVWHLLGGSIAQRYEVGAQFFVYSLPLFFLAFLKGVWPGLFKGAPYFHTVLWAMIGPFLFGAFLIVLMNIGAAVMGAR